MNNSVLMMLMHFVGKARAKAKRRKMEMTRRRNTRCP